MVRFFYIRRHGLIRDRRYTLPIDRIIEETDDVRTFSFAVDIPALPGQFIMLTDFNGNEKPFSLSDHRRGRDGYISVSIKRIGNFTSDLFKRKEGDLLSIRGAYGSPFFVPGGGARPKTPQSMLKIRPAEIKTVLCGGGFGLPPLYLLAKHLLSAGVPADGIRLIGAGRTEGDLLFEDRFKKLGIRYSAAVERPLSPEGGDLLCGTAADGLAAWGDGANLVYASGPDLMMKSLVPVIPDNAECQFLFERYMKCAIGICGSCVIDPGGIRVCKEGPALWLNQVEAMDDFGKYRRTASGSIEVFKNRLAGAQASERRTG